MLLRQFQTQKTDFSGSKANSVVTMTSQQPHNQQMMDGAVFTCAIYGSLAPTCIQARSQALFSKWPDVLLLAHNHPADPTLSLTGDSPREITNA